MVVVAVVHFLLRRFPCLVVVAVVLPTRKSSRCGGRRTRRLPLCVEICVFYVVCVVLEGTTNC